MIYFLGIHVRSISATDHDSLFVSGTCILNSDGSGSKIFDPDRVNFLWLRSGWVRSAIYGLALNLENLP